MNNTTNIIDSIDVTRQEEILLKGLNLKKELEKKELIFTDIDNFEGLPFKFRTFTDQEQIQVLSKFSKINKMTSDSKGENFQLGNVEIVELYNFALELINNTIISPSLDLLLKVTKNDIKQVFSYNIAMVIMNSLLEEINKESTFKKVETAKK